MAKGARRRHGGSRGSENGVRKIQSQSQASSSSPRSCLAPWPPFTATCSPPKLLTLQFVDASVQHRALSRMEAFYESGDAAVSSTSCYLNVEQAAKARLCRNYIAFNLPIDAVRAWLKSMESVEHEHLTKGRSPLNTQNDNDDIKDVDDSAQNKIGDVQYDRDGKEQDKGNCVYEGENGTYNHEAEKNCIEENSHKIAHLSQVDVVDTQGDGLSTQAHTTDAFWWKPFCTSEEVALLTYLAEVGALETPPTANAPQYLVSTSAATAATALPHERCHALFYLSLSYRATAVAVWENALGRSERTIIENDLRMRGYAPHVWADEFQAYVCGDKNPREFGNRTQAAFEAAYRELAPQATASWNQLANSLSS